MVDASTHELVDGVLRAGLGRYDFERSDIVARRDQDNEPALFIIAHFKQAGTIPASLDTAKAMSVLRRRLLDRGDERFPYLDYVFPREPADEAA